MKNWIDTTKRWTRGYENTQVPTRKNEEVRSKPALAAFERRHRFTKSRKKAEGGNQQPGKTATK